MSVLVFLAAAATASAVPERAADIAALRVAKLNDWPRFYRANDADGLARFLADGFVAMSHDGSIETKAEAVAWVRANRWANAANRFRYDISGVTFYGPATANVYGVGSMDGKGPDGAACRLRYTSANIFVRQAGRWRPSFSHTSKPACAPAATAG